MLKDERPFGLIEFDTVSRQIRKFGRRGVDIEICYQIAMKILKQLKVSGDNIATFVKIGEFRQFFERPPSVT